MMEMKQIARLKSLKRLQTTLVQGLIGLAMLLLPQQGHALSFTVDSVTAGATSTFDLNLNVLNAIDLTSWQFDLAYDPTIVQANLVTEGPFLAATGGPTIFSPGLIDNTAGLISLVSNAYVGLTPPSGSGVLATVSFTALAQGVSPITASNVFFDFSNSGVTVVNGATTVTAGTPVPEPSSFLLLLLSGGMLWGMRRWRGAGESSEVSR